MQAFNNKDNRGQLFSEFMAAGKDMDRMALQCKRRLLKSKLSEAVYRPKTHDELIERYGDESYVALIEKDAEKKRRVSKDALAPNDATRNKFWVPRVLHVRGRSEHQILHDRPVLSKLHELMDLLAPGL